MSPAKPTKSVEETRRALLDAGRHVFAEQGFAGARVDQIAERAGVNKALINYHFGGKAELFEAIIEDFTGRMLAGLRAAIPNDGSPRDQLRSFIRYMAEAVAHNPEFPRILISGAIRAESSDFEPPVHVLGVLQTLGAILERGRQEGVFRAIPALFAHVHIMSSFAMFHITRPLRERMRDQMERDMTLFSVEAFNRFVEGQIIAGFTATEDDSEIEP